MLTECPSSEIAFSQMGEDPALELEVAKVVAARRGEPVRALLVGSGGCTALSLLTTNDVESVCAVELSEPQRHLIELKRVALAELRSDEVFTLLEADEEVSGDARLDLFERIKEDLPEDTRFYWEARSDIVAYGVNRCGQLEGLFREVRAAFADLGIDPVNEPAKALGSPDWKKIFAVAFEHARLAKVIGAAGVGYSRLLSFSEHFSRRFAESLRRFASSMEDNYLLLSALRGRFFPDRGALPPYLDPAGQDRIKQLGVDRLTVHGGTFVARMQELADDKPFDLIVTSYLTDWLPAAEVHQLFSTAKGCLADNGAVLARRLNADLALGPLVSRYLTVDAALTADLRARDRSCLSSEVVVGFAG